MSKSHDITYSHEWLQVNERHFKSRVCNLFFCVSRFVLFEIWFILQCFAFINQLTLCNCQAHFPIEYVFETNHDNTSILLSLSFAMQFGTIKMNLNVNRFSIDLKRVSLCLSIHNFLVSPRDHLLPLWDNNALNIAPFFLCAQQKLQTNEKQTKTPKSSSKRTLFGTMFRPFYLNGSSRLLWVRSMNSQYCIIGLVSMRSTGFSSDGGFWIILSCI